MIGQIRNRKLEKELQRKEKALAKAAALLALKKTGHSYGRTKGRLIQESKTEIVPLIEEAYRNGARYHQLACCMSVRYLTALKTRRSQGGAGRP